MFTIAALKSLPPHCNICIILELGSIHLFYSCYGSYFCFFPMPIDNWLILDIIKLVESGFCYFPLKSDIFKLSGTQSPNFVSLAMDRSLHLSSVLSASTDFSLLYLFLSHFLWSLLCAGRANGYPRTAVDSMCRFGVHSSVDSNHLGFST